jgi:hypothetical protein
VAAAGDGAAVARQSREPKEGTMNIWKLSTFAFASLFVATVAVHSVPTASADKQPLMQSALDSLQAAAKHLENATPDKGGHRVKAIQLTKSAIDEVKAGIAFDNKH